MTQRYKKISRVRVRKQFRVNRPFFIEASSAFRRGDSQKGLLLQHQQNTRYGSRKQGASFFVREQDLPRFVRLLNKLLQDHGTDFSRRTTTSLEEALGRGSGLGIRELRRELEKLEERFDFLAPGDQQQLDELVHELQQKVSEIASLSQELHEARGLRLRLWLTQLSLSLPQFREKLNEFKQIIEHGKSMAEELNTKQETLYQTFLTDNFWMFGISYISAKSQRRSSPSRIPDLLLERSDGFQDVVELENPTDRLFVQKSGRYEISAELKEALAQTMDYVDDYAVRYSVEFYEHSLDTYKPRGIVVIGRSDDRELERRRRQLNSYLHGIEVWTYDDLLHNAEQLINLVERAPTGDG